jgi:hypothetical protein
MGGEETAMFKPDRFTVLIMGAMLSFGSGCLAEEDPEAEAIGEEVVHQTLAGGDGGGNGIITGNGAIALTPELLNLYLPVARLLTLVPLDGTVLETSDLLTTVLGRSMVSYLVKCALPEGQSVSSSFLGVTHTFPGRVGVAPEWTSGPLSASGRRWLTACVLAHVNATGANVNVLLKGNHPALGGTAGSEGDAYTLREGAFYGDIFKLVPESYACPGVGSTANRVCTQSLLGLGLSPCLFLVPGACRGLTNTCEGLSNGYYTSCHSGLILPLLPSTKYPETITVYLQP